MTLGNYFSKVPTSIDYQMKKYNDSLLDLSNKHNNLFLFDINQLIFHYGNPRDLRLFVTSDLHFSLSFSKKLVKSIFDFINVLNGNAIKCVIIDLDNTIWGGVIGDDGMDSIKIGYYGIGKAFTELQIFLKSLKERGIIICVCSKNDELIARSVFTDHPEMILSLDDISVFVSNWENKVDNIKYIQETVNIGFESIIFLDDNPVERDMVRSSISKIIVPDLPEDPSYFKDFLVKNNFFETNSFSTLDVKRTSYIQQEALRKEASKNSFNLEEYLESLIMRSSINQFSKNNISRVHQLIQRTNQFNATTKRYSEKYLDSLANDSSFITYAFSLEDKFGSNGIVGCLILKVEDSKTLFLDTFVMSCRVFNRKLEYFIFDMIKTYLKSKDYDFLVVKWIKTKKIR